MVIFPIHVYHCYTIAPAMSFPEDHLYYEVLCCNTLTLFKQIHTPLCYTTHFYSMVQCTKCCICCVGNSRTTAAKTHFHAMLKICSRLGLQMCMTLIMVYAGVNIEAYTCVDLREQN